MYKLPKRRMRDSIQGNRKQFFLFILDNSEYYGNLKEASSV